MVFEHYELWYSMSVYHQSGFKFTSYQLDEPKDCNSIVVVLINIILEYINNFRFYEPIKMYAEYSIMVARNT